MTYFFFANISFPYFICLASNSDFIDRDLAAVGISLLVGLPFNFLFFAFQRCLYRAIVDLFVLMPDTIVNITALLISKAFSGVSVSL